MFSWFFTWIVASAFCEGYDHFDEFLQNATLEDVYNVTRYFQAKKFADTKQQALSDLGQESLVLSDGTAACEAGWDQYSGNGCCYKLTVATGTWYEGTGLCKALHPCSQMASFHSQAECQFVASKNSMIHAWTGLSKTQVENTWTNTDGTSVFTWFLSSSSNNAKTAESCVELVGGLIRLLYSWTGKDGQMHNYDCTEKISSICKYCPAEVGSCSTTTTVPQTTTTMTTTITTPTTTTETTTPTTSPTTTTEKTSETTTPVATTVLTTLTSTPTTKTETTTVTTTTEMTTTTMTPITTLTTTTEASTPTTTTVTTITETTTETTTSTIPTTTPTTVVITTPTVPTVATTTTLPAILTTTVPATTSKSTASPSFSCTSSCPSSQVQYSTSCIQMCQGDVTFEKSCEWCNGTMLTVTNKEENDFIARVFGKNNEETSQIWIANTVSSLYLNWAPGQPSKPEGDGMEYCIAMDLTAGKTRGKHRLLPCSSTVVNSLCLQNP